MMTEEQWAELEREHGCDRGDLTSGGIEKKMNALDVQIGGGHYKDFPIQPFEYNQRNKLPFGEACIVKYVSRHKSKNGIEDLRKAKHFLELIAEMEYGVML